MNAQFQIAQLSGSTPANNAAPPRIYKLTKPLGDQAVVVNLGYDQKVKVDFSAIANEKITLVHVGEKLIILFDNKSTVTVEPFFDSRNDGLDNMAIEVAPGREVTVNEFASLFPITTDQSVLPAAGESGNAQASGANFSNSAVDGLGTGNPLDLLGQEFLGTFALTPETYAGTPNVAASASFMLANILLIHDETFGVQGTANDRSNLGLPAVFNPIGLIGWAQTSDPLIATENFDFGSGVSGTISYALVTAQGTGFAGVSSGLRATATGNEIFLFTEGNLIVGRESNAGGAIAFELYLDPVTLKLSIAQYEAVQHGNPGDANDRIELDDVIFVQQTLTDGFGNVFTAVSGSSVGVGFDDDGPAIAVSVVESEREGPTGLATLSLDESIGNDPVSGWDGTFDDVPGNTSPDPNGINPIGQVKTYVGGEEQGQGALQALFNVVKVPGADGEKSTTYQYSFSLTGGFGPSGGVATTLEVTDPTGQYPNDTIYLFKVSDTEIVGRVGNDPNGPIAIRITLDNAGSLSGGQLVINQYMAIDHGPDGNDFDSSKALTLAYFGEGEGEGSFASLGITLTATITDVDNDTATSSATIEIAGNETSSITFRDDGPVLVGEGGVIGTVDEDGLPGHNTDSGNPSELAGTGSAVATGSLASLVDFGTDGPGTKAFSLDVQVAPIDSGLTSQGGHVLIVSDGTTLHGYVETGADNSGFSAGDREIFTLTIEADGSYTFTLKDQIDHPTLDNAVGDNSENELITTLDLSAFVIATDGDGDSISLGEGAFKVQIQDDVPLLTGASLSITVDEDDINNQWSHGTSPSDGNADGSYTDDIGAATGAAMVTGTLVDLVSVGADEPGTFGFSSDAIAKLTALGLYSKWTAQGDGENGKLLSYAISNGPAGSNEIIITGSEPNPNGNPVLSLTLNTVTGAYEFKLYDELVHTAGDGENSGLRSGPIDNGVQHSIPNIDLGSIITYTDKDGDSVTLTGKFVVNVTDDVPKAVIDPGGSSVTIDETPGNQADDTTSDGVRNLFAGLEATLVDGVPLVGDDPDVPGDNNGGNSGNGAIAYAQSAFEVVTGHSIWGADAPLYPHQFSLSVAGGNNVASGLFVTDGSPIMLSLNANGMVIGTVSGGAFDGKVAFAIVIDLDGRISVAQYLSIRHDDRGDSNETNDNGNPSNDAPPADGQTIQQTLEGKIVATLTITDSDGDQSSASINIGHLITFLDDGPTVTATRISAAVDEDGLATANLDDGRSGETAGTGSAVATGSLAALVSFGADGPGATPFALAVQNTPADSGLNSGGSDVLIVSDGSTLRGYVNLGGNSGYEAGTDREIFTLTVNPDGSYTFTLKGQIDHPSLNGNNGDNAENLLSTVLDLSKYVVATDGDGDSVELATGAFTIQVRDDIPVIGPTAEANNLVVNGSFESGHGLGNNQWSIYHSLGGWTSADIGAPGPSGNVPFEIQTGNAGGVFAQHGNALVELDSDLSSGDLSGGDHFNNSGHTNSTLQQVIAGSQAGEAYELTFYYSPRPNEGNANSGSLDVLWNGQVVKSIDSTGMTAGVWQQITVSVVGTGPGDVLAFKATGQENSLGAFIDNVSLVPVTFVDEDGLTGLSTGNNDVRTGDNFVANGDGDNNEATSTGYLNIKWGADNADSGVDTTAGPFGTLIQDQPNGVGDRSLTFTNTTVGVSGVTTLTSKGETVVFSANSDGTILTGKAGGRTVIEISLSDEGTGAFRVVLTDQLDHATGNNENDIRLTFNYTATDSDGDSVNGSFTIGVDDDMPVAANDGPYGVVEDGVSLVSGNVLTNDASGADEPKTFLSWGPGDATAIAALNTYGTLVQNANGTWSYKLNNSLAATQALTSSSHLSYTLHYTMTDADGDQSAATLTINIDGANDGASVVTAQATGADATVYEAGLNPNGSNAASSTETTSGTFAISATDGVKDVVIGGVTFTLAQIQAFGTTNGVVNTGEGVLKLTGYSGNGFGGTVSYSYTLSATIDNDSKLPAGNDSVDGAGFNDSVALTVHGNGGTSASDNLVVRAVDDTPTAANDTWAPIITGATILTGLLGNDTFGADGVDADNSPVGGQITVTNGAHGTVVYNNNGTFTYTPVAGYSGADSFTYTIKDGDGDTSTATVTLASIQNNTVPTAGSATASVDDEGLPNGIAGSTFGDDLAGQAITASGNLPHDYKADGKAASDPINFLPMHGTSGQVGTETVTYSWNAANNTLTATSAERGAIFTVQVDGGSDNGNGNYVFTLLKPVLHSAGDNENDATVSLTYEVKDATLPLADKATGTLSITLDDDIPVAAPIVKTVTEGASDTNIMLILDRSGSMGFDSGVDGYDTRLDLLKAAANELLDQYDAAGDVRVRIVRFNDSAQQLGDLWLSVADAKTYINNLTANDGTDYDDAAALAPDAFADAGKLTTAGVRNVSYFISDGQPEPVDDQVSGTELTNWINFVNANDIISYAIGLGPSAPSTYLDPLAYDGRGSGSGTDTDALIVTDLNQLQSTLAGTVNPSISGSVIDGGIPTSFGADGGYVKSIEIGGKLYSYNPVSDTIGTSGPNGGSSHTFDQGSNKLTITFPGSTGESFVIDLDDGTYVYTPPTTILADFSRQFTYTLTDRDGDTANSTLTINIDNVNGAPVLDATDSPIIAAVSEDAVAPTGPVGTLVSSLVDVAGNGGLDNVTDADGPGLGIAITGTNSANGTWYYSTNNGTTWLAVGAVSSASALLLEANASTRLYFQPAANFNGTVNDGITFRAWDESTGTAGTKVDTTANGGSSAFSSATDTASVTVTPANDAPTITAPNGGNPASISVAENTTFVTDVNATDIDPGTTLTYSISGGADAAKFQINSSTGVLSFISAPNFEAPTDAGGNNVYDVIVRVSDGIATDTQAITVTVTNANDAPVGFADRIYTNASSSGSGTTIVLQNAWLVKNDTDLEGDTLNVGTASNGNDVSNVNEGPTTTSIRVKVDQGEQGNFFYTATDGSLSSGSTTVTVYRSSSNSSITGGNGNDILIGTGSTAATLDGGAGSDFVTGGSGNDTLVADQSDYLLNGGNGSDTLRVNANFTSTSDAQIVSIENVTLMAAATLDLSNQTDDFTITGSAGVDSITAGSGDDTIVGAQNDSLLAGGGGTDTLQVGANFTSTSNGQITGIETVQLTAAATLNLSNQSEAFKIIGSSGIDTITGGSGNDVINAGAGNDTLTGGGGIDEFRLANNTGTDTITDFVAGTDNLAFLGTTGVSSYSSFAAMQGTDDDRVVIISATNQTTASIQSADAGDNASDTYVLVFNEALDRAEVWFDTNWNDTGNRSLVGILSNITTQAQFNAIGAGDILSYASVADPIVLDLDHNGVAFSSLENGVSFDINGDGAKDQLAWTADGQDGILALDLDGSGKIESGNELFTPNFNGGHFADGIAALASLDGNHDGVIDGNDATFRDLVVWQDANHNGVSDGGELIKLTDLGITSIGLATTPGSPIDGQTIAGIGSFTYADGATGTFVEVDLDASLGAPLELSFPQGDSEGAGTLTHFTAVDQPLMHDANGDTSAAASKLALAIVQAGGTVDTAHLQPGV